MATAVTEQVPVVKAAVGACWELMTSNPILELGLVVGVVYVGFRMISKAKRAVRI